MNTKICSRCKEEKDHFEFNKCSKEKSGLKPECRSCGKLYRKINNKKIIKQEKAVRLKNRDSILESRKRHYYKYRSKILKHQLGRQKIRLKTDVSFRLIRRLRNRVYYALKDFRKDCTTIELLGCSVERFKSHLESQFQNGMTWKNYGQWHVDHIRPCASFDLSDAIQLKKCFHYSNTQPLWAKDNIKKKDSY